MKKDQGNIIIIFVIILLIIVIFMLFSLKNKIQQGWTSSSSNSTKLTETQLSKQATPAPQEINTPKQVVQQQPSQTNDRYEYYNDISVIQDNEALNPFIVTYTKTAPIQQPNSKNNTAVKEPTRKAHENLIKTAPNGFQLPNQTNYLTGYNVNPQNGKLNITIDNSVGLSNLVIFLYFKKPYAEQRNLDLNRLSTAIYISAGDKFTFTKVPSGYYKIVWVNLANKKAFKSKDFAVFQDNKYAYDRIFTFYPNSSTHQNKASEIALASIY